MKEQILKKIFNEDGSIKHIMTETKRCQKYFTKKELGFIYSIPGKSFSERYWNLKYDIKEIPRCPCCGNELKFNSFKEGGYQKYCSNSCTCKMRGVSDETRQKHIKDIDHLNTSEARAKKEQTNIKKFGGESPFCDKDIKEKAHEKAIETIKKRYDVYNPSVFLALYEYNGNRFDSSWEVCYYIYCKDHNLNIKRNYNKYFEYTINDKKYKYYPDFDIDGNYVEIKSKYLMEEDLSNWDIKQNICNQNNIKIISDEDIKSIKDYVFSKYGAKYLSQFRLKRKSDYKRKIIEITDGLDISKYRNDNIRFHHFCKNCGNDVFATYKVFTHFNDFLCKKCRTLKMKTN